MISETELLPQSVETEQSLLAACLLFPECADEAAELLNPDDFYRSAHRKIFESIARLKNRKAPVEIQTVFQDCKDAGTIGEIGGGQYLSALIDEHPVTTSIRTHAGTIRTKAAARRMIAICHGTIKSIHNAPQAELSEIIDKTQSQILNLATETTPGKSWTAAEITTQAVERYEAMNERGRPKGIPTGFETIDLVTGGMCGSKLVIIAARPRIGKTALMLNMARNQATFGHQVGIFSIEMDKEALEDRLIALESGINSMRLSMGTGPSPADWPKIMAAAERISRWKLAIDDTGGISTSELKRRIRRMVKDGAEIIYIDQLSKIIGNRRKSKFEESTEIVEELGTLKKELRVPIVLLAQINRKLEDRGDKVPGLGDLKNTGQLEEEGDLIFFIHREWEYNRTKEELKDKGMISIAKHRMGPTRDIPVVWDARTTRFYER